MEINVKTQWINETAHMRQAQYRDGSIALQLFDEYGSPLMTPTVNLEAYGEHPAEGNVFIKDWSENQGILQSLIDEKVISEPIRQVPAGFTFAYECTLLVNQKD